MVGQKFAAKASYWTTAPETAVEPDRRASHQKQIPSSKMKNTFNSVGILALILTTFGSFMGIANGAVLLIVDVSDPSAVVITATSGLASQTGSSGNTGFDLRDFYRRIPTGGFAAATVSNLVTWENGTLFDNYFITSSSLNLFSANGGPEFTAGTRAFSGSITLDLSANVGILPFDGNTGNVTFFQGSGPVFGEWRAGTIPEPSLTLLLGMGALGFAGQRRRVK